MPGVGVAAGTPFVGTSRAGGPFKPTDYPGCKLWLPAEQGISLLSPSVDRARWLDRSGNFFHVNQTAAANKPALDGKRLEFEKANTEHLTRAALAGISNGYTIGVALRWRTVPTTWSSLFNNGAMGGSGVQIFGTMHGTRGQRHEGVGQITWGSCTTNPERWILRHDGAGASADFCLNGSHQTPKGLANNIAPVGTLTVGGHAAPSYPCDIDIDAIYLYPSRLNDANTLLLDNQLAALQNGTAPPGAPGSPDLALYRPDWYSGQAVSDWANQGTGGALRDIAQALVAKQMVLIPKATPAGGPALHGDGVDDFMRGTWTQGQPVHRFMAALMSESAASAVRLADGGVRSVSDYVGIAPNRARMWSGGGGLSVTAPIDAWQRIESGHNGASSRLRVGDLTPDTGNVGTNAPDGFTLAATFNGLVNNSDSLTAEIIEYDSLRTMAQGDKLHAYLARHGC